MHVRIEHIGITERIRFVLNNHSYYDTYESLRMIMSYFDLTPSDFTKYVEPWYQSNKWWINEKFMKALNQAGIDTDKLILATTTHMLSNAKI